MKICVTTIYTDKMSEIAEITAFNNFKSYCNINKYDLKVTHLPDDSERPVAWYKILEVKKLIETNQFDWIFFIDVDCLFMTPTIRLEDFINDDFFLIIPSNNDVFETPVRNKFGSDGVASCQFLIKNCKESLDFLEDIWEAKDISPEMIHQHDWEQRQFKYSINNPKFIDGVNIIEEKMLNRYWYTNNVFLNFTYKGVNKNIWEIGDFIIHIPGYHREERWRILNELNMLSGGVISKFQRSGNKITFSPMLDLNNITIRLYINNNNEIGSYKFESMNHKLEYYIITNTHSDLIIKTFNNENKLIGIKEI